MCFSKYTLVYSIDKEYNFVLKTNSPMKSVENSNFYL